MGVVPPGFVVAPANANDQLTALVASAQHRIDLYAEKLMPSPLLDAILAAAKRGVDVRILAAPIDRGDRVGDVLLAAVQKGHLQVRIPRQPRVHAKLMIVDDQTVFLGSENVQDSERARRRELGIMFADPEIEARLASTFDRDWSTPGFSLGGHP
jgi:phosphatidylserine/phosphatidylglycerophosphate/cardiolipin synthase-like enzyme